MHISGGGTLSSKGREKGGHGKYAQVPLIRHPSTIKVLCTLIVEGCRIRGTCAYFSGTEEHLARVVSLRYALPRAKGPRRANAHIKSDASRLVLRTGCEHGP